MHCIAFKQWSTNLIKGHHNVIFNTPTKPFVSAQISVVEACVFDVCVLFYSATKNVISIQKGFDMLKKWYDVNRRYLDCTCNGRADVEAKIGRKGLIMPGNFARFWPILEGVVPPCPLFWIRHCEMCNCCIVGALCDYSKVQTICRFAAPLRVTDCQLHDDLAQNETIHV